MLKDDRLANVLVINLTKMSFKIENRKELFEEYIGGTGVGTQLLHEFCPEGADPLGPDNPIILTVGPLNTLFPLASKTSALFKSPHTGNLGESHCGGRSATAIRTAGYGSIVITGKSEFPLYLKITEGKVEFKDATTLWGMSNNSTTGRILREKDSSPGIRTIMRIGRAGEQLVTYSSVTAETYRHFGRLGLGAVFGSKNLKAIIVSGNGSVAIEQKKEYRELYDEIYNNAVNSEIMKKYHELGTPANILSLNKLGGFPTRNLQQSTFEGAIHISGEKFAAEYLSRRLACSHCPVACIHLAMLREPYEDDPYFYKSSSVCYDYEPIYALGSMLGGTDIKGMLKLMDRIEAQGLDVMSAGVILAWATEALEKGAITTEETAGIELKWNDYENYIKFTDAIVEQPNEFYKTAARGVDELGKKYNAEEYALAFGKNEMPGYHTGPAAHVGYLAGTRHSHLDNAGYGIDQKTLIEEEMAPEKLADKIVHEEEWRQILSSLCICFFARNIYTKEITVKALNLAGFDVTKEDIEKIGQKIYKEKYRFKIREGFELDNIKIPKRIFKTKTPLGLIKPEYVRETLEHIKRYVTSN